MNEYYPYTVIPQKVISIMQEQIPLPKLPKLISAPKKLKRKFIGTLFFVVTLSTLIIISLLNVANIMVTYFMFFVTLISLVAAIFEFAKYGKLKKHYEKEMKYYIERQKAYKKIKIEREKIVHNNKDKEIVSKFRQEKVHTFFGSGYDTINAVHNEYSLSKRRFKLFLEEYFSDEILDNVKVVHRTKKINYVPDFIIQVENPKLNVSIEIEEPYALSNVPENIQKDYEAKDRLRQRFANELGWLVIIISEEQSILNPTECCKYIEDSMSNVLNDIKRNKDFENIKDIEKQKMLTGEERATLKKEKYRESYLIKAGLMDKPLTKKLNVINDAKSNENLTYKNKTNDNSVKQNDNSKKTVIINKKINKPDIKADKNTAKPDKNTNNNDQMKLIRKYADKANTYQRMKDENNADKPKETVAEGSNKNSVLKQKNIINNKTVEEQKVSQNNESKLQTVEKKPVDNKVSTKNNEINQKQTVDKKAVAKQNNSKGIEQNNVGDKKNVETVSNIKSSTTGNEKTIVENTKNIDDKKNNIVKNEAVDKQSNKTETSKNAVKVETITKRESKSVEEIIRRRKQDIQNKLRNKNKSQSNLEKPESKETKTVKPADTKEIKSEIKDSKSEVKEAKVEPKVAKTELKSEKNENKSFTKPDTQTDKKVVVESKSQQENDHKQKLIDSHRKNIEGAVFDKKWDELINLCDNAIAELPSWAWAYYRRSTALGHKKEFSKAVLDCNKAIAYNPTFAEAYYNRGTANFFLAKYMDASNDYEKAISLNYVKKEEAHFNRGLCLLKLENRRKAYQEFLKAKELGYQKAEEIIKSNF